MKPFSILILTVLVAGLGPQPCPAQTRFAGGVHFNVGFPRGELHQQVDRNAYGVSGNIFYSPQSSPLAIGLEGAYMTYGNEDRREPFSTTIPDVTVNVNTSNNIVQGFLVLRGQSHQGPIRPYVDGVLGFNYLFTKTKISDSSNPGDDIASTTNWDDTAFAYGVGGGLMIPVHTGVSVNDGPFQVLIDAGARYLRGGEAEYLKQGSIYRDNGKVSYDSTRSRTDMVKLHLGVTVRFSK